MGRRSKLARKNDPIRLMWKRLRDRLLRQILLQEALNTMKPWEKITDLIPIEWFGGTKAPEIRRRISTRVNVIPVPPCSPVRYLPERDKEKEKAKYRRWVRKEHLKTRKYEDDALKEAILEVVYPDKRLRASTPKKAEPSRGSASATRGSAAAGSGIDQLSLYSAIQRSHQSSLSSSALTIPFMKQSGVISGGSERLDAEIPLTEARISAWEEFQPKEDAHRRSKYATKYRYDVNGSVCSGILSGRTTGVGITAAGGANGASIVVTVDKSATTTSPDIGGHSTGGTGSVAPRVGAEKRTTDRSDPVPGDGSLDTLSDEDEVTETSRRSLHDGEEGEPSRDGEWT